MQTKDGKFVASKLKKLGVWNKLKGKRILVTGGTGFVGHWLDVPGLDVTRLNSAGYLPVLRDKAHIWDYIIHAAPCDPTDAHHAARVSGARYLHISSGAVYDNPMSEIGRTHLRYEAFTNNHADDWGLDAVTARIFTIAGYGARPGRFALDTWIRQGMAGQPLTVFNDGLSQRSYIYGADMAVWLLTILAHGVGVYDVGGVEPVRMYHVAEHIANHFAVSINHVDNNLDPRPVYVPTIPMRADELGLEIWTPFFWKAIDKTIEE
jgi:nucleoside-diphosphate-sugar epimerase